VKVSFIDESGFLLVPVREGEWWVHSLQERKRGWVGTIDANGVVEISGVMGTHVSYTIMELTGTFVNENAIKGQAVMRVGTSLLEAPYVYKSEWGLEPVESAEPLTLSHKVTYHGPPIPVTKMTVPSAEERAQRPATGDLKVKQFAKLDPHKRDRFYQGLTEDDKQYFDTLLTELTWEEIPYTPGILLLIDHLVTVDEELKQKIAEGYVRDGSLHFFEPIPYEELQQVPPLFLILYVFEKMPEGDIAGLQEVSSRFVTMLEAYKVIPPEELTDLPLLEFITKLSEQLPEEFRRTYFSQSPKLRNYVAASEDERLKELYPF
jgi:hypothetical protein